MSKFFSRDYDVQITAAAQTFRKTIELDKSVKAITHYTILSNREDLAYYRGSFKLDINKDEIAPDGYSVKKVMCWPTIPPDARLKSIGRRETGNGQIQFEYTDSNDGLTTFQPYVITLSVEGERED
ncbi:MAG: hypothetical protein K0S33_3733 [Bacteroidetes bacterium]|jgi:hypothetical protein|nr:hypothetical protein [Bacteroidota bacterium]